MMKTKLLILFILLSFSTLFADVINYDKVIRNLKGVKSYEKENYENSEENFKRNSIKYPKDSRDRCSVKTKTCRNYYFFSNQIISFIKD